MNCDLLILYASCTGTSESLANHLAQQLQLRNLKALSQNIQDFPISSLPIQSFVLFIISTTGQGDVPPSMLKFYQTLLLKHLPPDTLSNLNFSIFGCGDSHYKLFNAAARKLYQRLLQLGAKSWVERGLGDDQDRLGIYQEFLPWVQRIYEALQIIFPENLALKDSLDIRGLGPKVFSINQIGQSKSENMQTKEVLSSQLLTPVDYDFQTYSINLQNDETYEPGDVIEIYPENDINLVEKVAKCQNYQIDKLIQVEFQENVLFQGSLLDYLKKIIDLTMPITQFGVGILAEFAQNPVEKEKLEEMASMTQDGIEVYYEYIQREKRNISEILYDFSSIQIPLEYLSQAVGLIKPRDYSISSSFKDNHIQITAAIKQTTTPFKRKVTGGCSAYFQTLSKGDKVRCRVKQGTLEFPKDPNVPTILVGPGTGIAPLLSFIKERSHSQQEQNTQTILFFGSKNQEKDFYYKDLLQSLESQKRLRLITAFSRDQDYKIYVQHRIKEYGQELFKLINDNLGKIKIFVCGSSKFMPDSVQEAFEEVMGSYYNDQEKGKQVIQQLISQKHYQLESW